jgi:hypothetical protein
VPPRGGDAGQIVWRYNRVGVSERRVSGGLVVTTCPLAKPDVNATELVPLARPGI